ncbi:MAG: ferrous iron transport protein B [Paludibacteraceae bacterium]|nr:ferrous iron transport protein B [Paludibacteraceae bacterium]
MGAIQHIEVALVGSAKSGKSALIAEMQKAADLLQGMAISFDEHHSHEEMDCEHHDVVLQVVDAMNLEQSLMLTPSFVDHRHPLVLAINRYDLLLQTHHSLRLDRFKELIGVPVVTVSSVTGEGVQDVLEAIVGAYQSDMTNWTCHPVVHSWEQKDEEAYRAYVQGLLHETLVHPRLDKHTLLEKVNAVLTNSWSGIPVLIVILSFVFWATFAIGEPLQNLFQTGVNSLHTWIVDTFPDGWLRSLTADGIVLGVGSLLTALPNIIILFFFLSLMEDTGYMSRVAYLMDGVMHKIGLHGRSFIPMLMGFDCNVPAIIAARDIQNPKDRALTVLMVPFMSCSARLPVYILFISVFFPRHKALVLGSLYLLGVALSFVFALIMQRTKWFRHQSAHIINELPDFKIPSWHSMLGHIWFRIKDFLQKISTVVLCASVIIWALEFFPAGDLNHLDSSWLAGIGKLIEPLMRPLGFDWKMSVCLLTGLPAKEAIVSTISILYEGDLTSVGFTYVSAYAFLVFTLLYFPCVATISTIRKEIGWHWSAFTVVHSVLLAWIIAFAVTMIGTIL